MKTFPPVPTLYLLLSSTQWSPPGSLSPTIVILHNTAHKFCKFLVACVQSLTVQLCNSSWLDEWLLLIFPLFQIVLNILWKSLKSLLMTTLQSQGCPPSISRLVWTFRTLSPLCTCSTVRIKQCSQMWGCVVQPEWCISCHGWEKERQSHSFDSTTGLRLWKELDSQLYESQPTPAQMITVSSPATTLTTHCKQWQPLLLSCPPCQSGSSPHRAATWYQHWQGRQRGQVIEWVAVAVLREYYLQHLFVVTITSQGSEDYGLEKFRTNELRTTWATK